MSVVEAAIEKVKHLDETHARKLLAWLQSLEGATASPRQPLGAMAMLGFVRRFRPQPRTTAEWMAELRAGESE
ncbi:MAG: hypothetical protein HYY24_12155 [Verrucomicrobia bacterium]|nr:hypothetical protein [Verrucomicrobiota bacterium]